MLIKGDKGVARKIGRNEIKQDILRLLKNNGKKAFRPKEIAKQLNYRDNKTFGLFRDVLSEMDEQKLIGRVDGGQYTFQPRATKIEGVLRMNPQGFGFVEAPGLEEDLYIRESNLKTALDGDRVLVGMAAPSRGDRRREGEVLKVLERTRTQAVGSFRVKGHFAFVVPDDKRLVQDVYVPKEAFNGATDGDKVVVSIDRFDDRQASPEGRVLAVLGPSDDPAVRVLSLAMSLDVRSSFPDDVEAYYAELAERCGWSRETAAAIRSTVEPSKAVTSGASPESTSSRARVSARAGLAISRAWPVPRRSSCTTQSSHSGGRPFSVRASRTRSSPGAVTTTTRSQPAWRAASTTHWSIGLPATLCRTLGSSVLSRVPLPAASTTAIRGVRSMAPSPDANSTPSCWSPVWAPRA